MIKNATSFLIRMEKRLKKNPERNLRISMERAVRLVKNEAVESIVRGARSGPTVTRYQPKREHQTSAAGQPPASDTGFLVSQISSEVRGRGKFIIGQVVSAAPYSAPLEFGTTNMAARPFLTPALKKNRKKIERIFIQEGII
tara:strand:- start:3907 stop:4332 length:426 start_codon:yes stop_codon:yes gene_type:complete